MDAHENCQLTRQDVASTKTAIRILYSLVFLIMSAIGGFGYFVHAETSECKEYTDRKVSGIPELIKSTTTIEINLRTLMQHEGLEYQEAN